MLTRVKRARLFWDHSVDGFVHLWHHAVDVEEGLRVRALDQAREVRTGLELSQDLTRNHQGRFAVPDAFHDLDWVSSEDDLLGARLVDVRDVIPDTDQVAFMTLNHHDFHFPISFSWKATFCHYPELCMFNKTNSIL